jgi:hypothetical protein
MTDRILLLLRTTDEAEQAIKTIEGVDLELAMRPLPQIREALKMILRKLDGNWEEKRAALNRIDFTALEFCSSLLSRFKAEKVLEGAVLKELVATVDSLSSQVAESALAEELKLTILEHLQQIRKAIINYPITGSTGIYRAQEAAIGTVIVNVDLFQAAKDTEEVGKYLKFLEVLSKAVTVGHTLLPLAPLLLGSGHIG